MTDERHPPERRESLWLLTVSPVIWSAHFLLSYITAAIWCAKAGPDAALSPVRAAIVIYTVCALAGIALTGWRGYRRHTFGTVTSTHDFDSPAGRHGFLGFAVVTLSTLSAVATIYVALPILFTESCR
jgi:hypothetical protein